MKINTKISIFVSVAILTAGCSRTVQTNAKPDTSIDSYSMAKEKEYQRGYQEAIKENKKRWIDIGFKQAEKSLSIYNKDIKAYEIGKYAIEENLVTNPRPYSFKDENGNIQMRVIGCEISTQKTSTEILSFYRKYADYIELIEDKTQTSHNEEVKNAPSDIGIDVISYYEDSKPNSYKPKEEQVIVRSFAKSYKMKSVVDQYGLNCTVGADQYMCTFNDQKILDDFCTQSGICN